MNAKIITRYIIREMMGLLILGVALFWSAGRINWWPAWAVLAIMAAWIIATLVVILRTNPGLLAERLGPRKGAKAWDTAIMSLLGVIQLARYIIAGLDQRYHWSGEFSLAVQIAAMLVCALGYVLVVWATASNAFFSQIVRIQAERNHEVATGGPYRYIRHPAYIGSLLFELAAPVLLSSWWSLWVSGLNVLLLILRTALEDQMLIKELPGYAEYAKRVKHRLVPGIW